MFTITQIFIIIFTHWVADFILQDEKWALGKSKNLNDLLCHTIVYSGFWFLPMLYLIGLESSLMFVCITFLFHTLTDYFTSKIVSKKFANNHYGSQIPNLRAFTTIGFDQILHYIQLFLTLQLFI